MQARYTPLQEVDQQGTKRSYTQGSGEGKRQSGEADANDAALDGNDANEQEHESAENKSQEDRCRNATGREQKGNEKTRVWTGLHRFFSQRNVLLNIQILLEDGNSEREI